MKRILATILLLSSFASHARAIQGATIYKIDHPLMGENDIHVYLSDGSVAKVSDLKRNMIIDLEIERLQNTPLNFDTDEKGHIHRYAPAQEITAPVASQSFMEYRATILDSEEAAVTAFKTMRKRPASWSQCYNRAHIWSYELKQKLNLDTMKVFMFYTRKYIREYNFEWWFHVAPFTYVKNGEQADERILDGWFTKAPTRSKEWTEIFMKNKVTCPVITKYSDYENHEEEQYCYLYKTSMYYLQPMDLDRLERSGEAKTEWNSYEVRRAYRNGFNVWF